MSGSNSGVRNLRAMFENQNASSPEPRGRSPAGSATSGASRPTSKVRASFVSVEPSGGVAKDLGTTKGTSANNPQAHRRESFSVSGDSEDVQELKKVICEEMEERKQSVDVAETIPEAAVESRDASREAPPVREAAGTMTNLGSIMKGSDFPETAPKPAPAEQPMEEEPAVHPGEAIAPAEASGKPAEPLAQEAPPENPDKVVSGVQEEASLKPADPTSEAAVAGGEALPPPTEALSHPSDTKTASQTPKADESKLKATDTPRTNGRAATKKPATISTSKSPARGTSSARSPLPRSPLPKTPTVPKPAAARTASKSPAPAKAQAKPAASKEASKPAAPKTTTRASARPSTATSGTTASAAAKAKAPVAETKRTTTKATSSAPPSKDSTTTSPSGFKKPRPRSPTRPVRLPSHLTAPTASYAAKHGEEAAAQKLARKPSTVSKPAPRASAPVAKKQPSRASLAPSTAAAKRPESRTSTTAGAGEGFLARMMRPTASSASKTHDKPTSPPRREAAAKPSAKPGLVTKTKKKVQEVADKAKDVVTNGHHEEKHDSSESTVPEPVAEGGAEAEPVPSESNDSAPAVEEAAHEAAAAGEPAPNAPATEETGYAAASEAPKPQEEAVF
ncbi:hypothetical protein BU23DRAFT_567480 [Bimuria novae-zelandiae CBS 107.79]|uniref:Mucin-7 n=1 Tax=Bimuria novae-zelandiae CBS 107.79 TaxID=1447943 RepID=A0A6A5VC42_9PLEO|nr:hypothetical protein BU23DRAFT_567480 [Bimuria novae-zelandiae CBS 107.79]